MDTRIYLDINRFARATPWAHAFAHDFALYGGVLLLGLLVALACLRARSRTHGGSPRHLAAALWAGAGTLVALGLNQPLSHAIGRPRPYAVLHHVEVLVSRANDFTMPSDHATVAGAVAVGLWLARDRLLAILATILAVTLSFARVYVGAHYPGDVLVGLCFGGLVVGVGSLVATPLLERGVVLLTGSPVRFLVAAHHREPPADPGPAAQQALLRGTGAVRVLEGKELAPRGGPAIVAPPTPPGGPNVTVRPGLTGATRAGDGTLGRGVTGS